MRMTPGPTLGVYEFTFADAGFDAAFGECVCAWLRRHPSVDRASHMKDYYSFKVTVRTKGPDVDAWRLMQAACRARADQIEALAAEWVKNAV
jgi:hypothetical protein